MLCNFRALRIIFIYIAIKEWDEKEKDGVTVYLAVVYFTTEGRHHVGNCIKAEMPTEGGTC